MQLKQHGLPVTDPMHLNTDREDQLQTLGKFRYKQRKHPATNAAILGYQRQAKRIAFIILSRLLGIRCLGIKQACDADTRFQGFHRIAYLYMLTRSNGSNPAFRYDNKVSLLPVVLWFNACIQSSFSTQLTCAPAFASAKAAPKPPQPPPTTTAVLTAGF